MKTITCEIPLTGLPDDVAKRVVGSEFRVPKIGEWWFDHGGGWVHSTIQCADKHPSAILRPEPWEGFKVLTGAAAIAMDECGEWYVYTSKPKEFSCSWDGRGMQDYKFLLELIPSLPVLPLSTGDWRRDIWLNPDHPANRVEGCS